MCLSFHLEALIKIKDFFMTRFKIFLSYSSRNKISKNLTRTLSLIKFRFTCWITASVGFLALPGLWCSKGSDLERVWFQQLEWQYLKRFEEYPKSPVPVKCLPLGLLCLQTALLSLLRETVTSRPECAPLQNEVNILYPASRCHSIQNHNQIPASSGRGTECGIKLRKRRFI